MKQVIENKPATISPSEADSGRIYIVKESRCNHYYKLTKFSKYKWQYLNRTNESALNCDYDTLQQALEDVLSRRGNLEVYTIYEFETLAEFAEWLVEETK